MIRQQSSRPGRGARAWANGGVRGLAALAIVWATSCKTGPDVVSGVGTAGAPAGGTSGGVATDGAFYFRADIAPIEALAVAGDDVWIGSTRGLRRMRQPGAQAVWVGATEGFPGKGVTALAADTATGVLVASNLGVGRLGLAMPDGSRVTYQAVAPLARVTKLLALATQGKAGAPEQLWAGTSDGLFHLNGGHFVAVPGTGGAVVTLLEADPDGVTVWAGLRGRGVVHADAGRILAEIGPRGTGNSLDFVETLGLATLPNGTRLAAGRGADGGARIVLLQLAGPTLLDAEPDVAVLGLVPGPGAPWLIAREGRAPSPYPGGGTAEPVSPARVFTLSVAARGQLAAAGVVRFSPARHKLDAMRLLAKPVLATAGDVTATLEGDDDDAWLATRASGVVHLTSRRAEALPAGELAIGARHLAVACVDRERCLLTTGDGRLYRWSGAGHDLTLVTPQGAAGATQALAGDGAGPIYGVFPDAQKRGFRLSRLGADWVHWDPLMEVPVPGEGGVVATGAWLAPRGDLWIAVSDKSASGDELGRGVLEVQLPDGKVIHHRPYKQGEPRPAEALPVSGEVRSVRFIPDPAAGGAMAIWFCTGLGVSRFSGGAFSSWTENDGLEDERCRDVGADAKGSVWMASGAGTARFDEQAWHAGGFAPVWPADRDGDEVEASALATWGGVLWAGTGRGLIATGRSDILDRAAGLSDDDVRDLVPDRFGRMWVRGALGVTMLPSPPRPSSPASPSSPAR